MNKISIDWRWFLPAAVSATVGLGLIAKFVPLGIGLFLVLIITIVLLIGMFRDPLFGVLALIFFLPFEKFPSITIGGIDWRLNHLIGGLLIITTLIFALIHPQKKLSFGGIGWLSAIFALALFTSIGVAVDQTRALIILVFILFMLGVYLAVIYNLDNLSRLWQAIKILFISAGVVVAFGFFQFAGDMIGLPTSLTLLHPAYTNAVFGFPRIHVFSGEPLYLGNYLLIPAAVGLALLLGRGRINRSLVGVVTAGAVAILILTLSRGAIVGFIASLLVVIVLLFKKLLEVKNLGRMLLIGILGVVIVIGIFWRLDPNLGERFTNQLLVKDWGKGESTVGRLNSYENAWQIFRDNPVRGIGLGNYGPWLINYPSEPKGRGWDIVNNEYLELASETGIIGLGAFLLLIVGMIWLAIRAYLRTTDETLKALIVGLLAAVVGILVQYNFFSTLYIFHVWAAFGLLVAASLIALNKSDSGSARHSGSENTR